MLLFLVLLEVFFYGAVYVQFCEGDDDRNGFSPYNSKKQTNKYVPSNILKHFQKVLEHRKCNVAKYLSDYIILILL